MTDLNKINFLYQSIADTQATIRALDVKTGFLFVVIFLPLTEFSTLVSASKYLSSVSSLFSVFILLALVFWVFSIASLFSCTVSISSPNKHVKGKLPDGLFFSSFLYKFNFIDNFFNFPIRSEVSIDEFMDKIPKSNTEIIKELSYEKMKLVYIRDIKIKRSSFCTKMTLLWLFLGVSLNMLYRIKGGG